MSSFLLTAPAAEPLTLDEARAFLRVDSGVEDELIAALIAAARLHVEAQTRRALIAQDWRLVRDDWPPDGRIAVHPSPLRALNAVRVYDGFDVAHAVDLQAFVADLARGAIVFAPWAVPSPGRALAGIELDVTVGFGADAAAVPEPLRQAMRLLVAHWYDQRGVVGSGGGAMPAGVAALIAPYRVVLL